MQNQDLVQTYPALKQPSNSLNSNHIAHKNLTDHQSVIGNKFPNPVNSRAQSNHRDESHLNDYNYLLGQEAIIQKILGYPVTQVIVDEQENLILDIGDLITYKAVELAMKANVFKKLLDAVYIKKQ